MISFSVNENSVSSSQFQQAAFEIVYDQVNKKYIHRFSGIIPTDKAQEVIYFLTDNIENHITISYEESLILENCRVTFMNADPVLNVCRINLEQGMD